MRTATRRQLNKIHALLPKAGIGDRPTKLAYYAEVACREVESGNALTYDEAGWVIDDLERHERGEVNLVDKVTAPTCPTCDGSGEVPVNPEAAWSGHVQVLTFRACGCGGDDD